jgi:hypothetical protein
VIPGFVVLGAVAVLFQLLVIGGFYGYLHYRRPVPDPATRKRAASILGIGAAVAAIGQLVGFGAIGYVRVAGGLTLGQAASIAETGVLVAGIGYLGVFAGFVVHSRAAE